MQKLFSLILFCCISVFLCAQSSILEIIIDPTKRMDRREFTLADLIDSIEYIPLQTNDKCLIGKVSKFGVSDNLIKKLDPEDNPVLVVVALK